MKVKNGTSRNLKADLVDISFQGMSVCIGEKIEPGNKIEFELIPKLSSIPIIGRGEIKYAKEVKKGDTKLFRMGVEFIDIDEQAIEFLLNNIQSAVAAEKRRKKKLEKKSPKGQNFFL